MLFMGHFYLTLYLKSLHEFHLKFGKGEQVNIKASKRTFVFFIAAYREKSTKTEILYCGDLFFSQSTAIHGSLPLK
jgi:hypothetical protein